MWSLLWFGMIMPGHTRGSIRVPGAERTPTIGSARSCCSRMGQPKPVQDTRPVDSKGDSGENSPGNSGGPGKCAICYLVATLDVPPPADVNPALTECLNWINDRCPARPVVADVVSPCLTRAPPIACA
ncbi:MAG: hypothetical protein IT440_00695 [Phycisphaeraceae bacterium]|nr:hypothetical protein [Phycisphaeraceae bacterium]